MYNTIPFQGINNVKVKSLSVEIQIKLFCFFLNIVGKAIKAVGSGSRWFVLSCNKPSGLLRHYNRGVAWASCILGQINKFMYLLPWLFYLVNKSHEVSASILLFHSFNRMQVQVPDIRQPPNMLLAKVSTCKYYLLFSLFSRVYYSA